MDIEQINALSDEHKNKYMLLQRLFDQPGFKYLIEFAKAQVAEATTNELNSTSWDRTMLLRGARHAYINFAEIEKFTEIEFTELANQELDRRAESAVEKTEAEIIDNE